MKRLLFLSALLLATGCLSSKEKRQAEKMAERQDAKIYTRKEDGLHQMYAELNNVSRRWVESGMRQTNVAEDKDKDTAYSILTEKMSEGSWVWRLKEVDCSECDGTGKVSYEEGDLLVDLNLAEPNVSYTCPMCNGIGILNQEFKEFENEK